MSHVVTIKLYDLVSNELADISGICLERTLKRRLNQARSFTFTAPAGDSLLTTVAGDGYANLRKGNRKLLVWEDGTIIFHGRVWTIERSGDGTQNLVTVTAFDPWMELGYDSQDLAGRPVRDDTFDFINPSFAPTWNGTTAYVIGDYVAKDGVSYKCILGHTNHAPPNGTYWVNVISGRTGAISGPDLIRQILTNSQNIDPTQAEGRLPIDLTTGTFDIAVPPAVDLSSVDSMDWPVLCGDFITQLVDTGVVDVDMRPVDPVEGFDAYVMVELSAVSSQGTDLSATVHFDYWTGSKNVSACRHVEDFSTICNKLYDYLGPRIDLTHWRANITPGSPGTTVDPTASRALYGGARPWSGATAYVIGDYVTESGVSYRCILGHTNHVPPNLTYWEEATTGQFMQIRVFDSIGSESGSRPLYIALWNAEQGLRVEPRDMLFITPSSDVKALWEPPADYDVGDLVAVNVGTEFGLPLAENQRVYGYDKSWDRQNVAHIAGLLTSADAE